jgi:anti-anti-sigma regulatory factor
MNTPPAKMLVLVGEKFSCIKLVGRANFNSSVDFRTLINELRGRGYSYFVLELSECVLMDSTFLGVLTGLGLKLNPAQEANHDGAIEFRNANARIVDLLENLGVLHLFKLSQGPLNAPAGTQTENAAPCNATKEEVTRACLEAHRTLMDVNPQNVAKFKDVTQFLAEDLKRMKAAV